MEEQQLQKGDRVSFDVEGHQKRPYGYGIVTRATSSLTLIQPDYPILAGMRMVNIKRVGAK